MNFVDPDGRDIVIYGKNNSSFVILTEDIDLQCELNIDWGGNYYFEDEEYLQTSLDVVGIFDPTGASDVANASIYLSNGEYGNALISVVGLVPYLGDTAKTLRLGKSMDALGSAIKLQKHHIIPKAVFNTFDGLPTSLKRDSRDNLKLVPAGFHGNHPSYSKWVELRLTELQKKGALTYDKFIAFKKEVTSHINNALKEWETSGQNMNKYFEKLLNQ